jgi:hypothetical protein
VTGGLSRFDRLTSVVITAPTNEAGRKLPVDVMKCLFRIPSLVTLDVACCPNLSRFGNEVNPQIMSGCIVLDRLTVLRLPLANAYPGTLKALLRFTPNLKTLVYDVLMPANSFPDEHLTDALATVPETLEELTLRVHMYVREAMDLSSLYRPVHGDGVGSLQRLRNLRSLKIPLALLFGVDPRNDVVPQLADVLPSSLETLHLVGDLTGFDMARIYGDPAEAILRSLLTGEERVDNSWNYACRQDPCDGGCRPVWAYRAPPRWNSEVPRLDRITIFLDEMGWNLGEEVVIHKDTCEALNATMSGQGLEVIHVEVDDYKDIF